MSNYYKQKLFNGRPEEYNDFLTQYYLELANKNITYIMDPQNAMRRLTPPVPNHALPTQFLMEQDFANRLKNYNKDVEAIPAAYHQAISILMKLLDPNISINLQHILHDNLLNPDQKLTRMLEYLEGSYAPNTTADVMKIQTEITLATDANGYRHLLDTITRCQNQFRHIYVRNQQGRFEQDPDGRHRTYEINDAGMRGILLQKLGNNGNDYFKNLRIEATLNPQITYQQLIRKMEILLKEPDLYDPLSIIRVFAKCASSPK
jgi:hypothetical protein